MKKIIRAHVCPTRSRHGNCYFPNLPRPLNNRPVECNLHHLQSLEKCKNWRKGTCGHCGKVTIVTPCLDVRGRTMSFHPRGGTITVCIECVRKGKVIKEQLERVV